MVENFIIKVVFSKNKEGKILFIFIRVEVKEN